MKGVQFAIDESGEKTAVVISLKQPPNFGRISTTARLPMPGTRSRGNRWNRSKRGSLQKGRLACMASALPVIE